MQNQFLSSDSPNIKYKGKSRFQQQKKEAPKVVIIIPPMRIPSRFRCEIDETPDNYNRNNPDWDDLTNIGFLHKHPDYKPRKT